MSVVQRVLGFLHRWGGLVTGLYLGMLGVSGALLVAAPFLVALEHRIPAIPEERVDAAYVSTDIWVEKARQHYGDLPAIDSFNAPLATPMRIAAPTMTYSVMREAGFGTGIVVVDPYTGEPLAHFIAQDGWSIIPLTLHMGFFLPFTIMWTVLAVLAWLVFGMSISGLVAWWPRKRRLREALTPVTPTTPARARRLHAALGAWTALPLLALALSGLVMSDKPLAAAVAEAIGRTQAVAQGMPCAGPAISPGRALDLARQTLPGHELGTMSVPAEAGSAYQITLRPLGSTMPVRGITNVVVSGCGEVLQATGASQAAMGDIVLAAAVDVHGGRLLGWPGEWIVFAAGIGLGLLPLIGLWSWFWRIKTQRRVKVPASSRESRHPDSGGAS